MQVTSRHRPRPSGGGRPTPARASAAPYPSAEAREQIRGFADRLNSSDPRQAGRGRADIQRFIENAQGPYLGSEELAAALREEIDHGALRASPEARLALAGYLADHGARGEAASRLKDACRVAADIAASDRPEARTRASAVNHEASILFHRIGDRYAGQAREVVSRFYSVPPNERVVADKIPIVPSMRSNREPGAAMHAPWSKVPVPDRLKTMGGDEPEPQMPPEWEEKEYPPIKQTMAVDLIGQLGTFVGAMRNLSALGPYLARCERLYRSRTYLTAPLRPADLRDLRDRVRRDLNSPDSGVRDVAAELSRRLDFRFLEEATRAYWGTAQ